LIDSGRELTPKECLGYCVRSWRQYALGLFIVEESPSEVNENGLVRMATGFKRDHVAGIDGVLGSILIPRFPIQAAYMVFIGLS
jgi:hypothetical protein